MLIFEFKRDLNAYLATRSGVPVGTLADVIQFNLDHAEEELKFFGQELMELAEAGVHGSGLPAGIDPRTAAGRAAGYRRDTRGQQRAGDHRADQHAGVADRSDQRRRVPVRQFGLRGGRRLPAGDGDRRIHVRSAGGYHVHGVSVERADAHQARFGLRSRGGCAAARPKFLRTFNPDGKSRGHNKGRSMDALAARSANSVMQRHAARLDPFLVPRLRRLMYL